MGLKKRSGVSTEFNMSSLTDIIFLLLIFFMLTSSMVVPNALNLQLPGRKTKSPPPQAKNTVISINDNDRYTLNGSRVNIRGIENAIDRLKARLGDKAAIVVSPSGKATNESVVAVLDLAYKKEIRAVLTDPR